MRYSLIPILFFPIAAIAEDFSVQAPVASAEVYPRGALVTRIAQVSVPKGQHRLIVTDLPPFDPATMQISLGGGAVVSSTQVVDASLASATFYERPEIQQAQAVFTEAQSALHAIDLERAEAQAAIEAAKARIEFAKGLSQGEGATPDRQAIYDLAGVVGGLVTDGMKTRIAAQQKLEALALRFSAAERDLARAREALEEVMPKAGVFQSVILNVSADAALESTLEITHAADASWSPNYEVRVTTGDTPMLEIKRRIGLTQQTGQDWTDVDLSFSTLTPSDVLDAREPAPLPRRIAKPTPQPAQPRMEMDSLASGLKAAVQAERRDHVATQYLGMDVRYAPAAKMDVASSELGGQVTQVELDMLSFDLADLYAIAVPQEYETAFLRARVKNITDEVLLPGQATFYRDGLLAGGGQLPMLVPNASKEIGLGEIRGLRLKRIIRDRLEGDSGIITRANETTEQVVLRVENITDRAWDVRLMDRVPYSEQEDLQITWSADPTPTEEDVDGKRGVLAWRNQVAPDQTWNVTLSHRIKWPEGYILR